jgi:hypothetical protein
MKGGFRLRCPQVGLEAPGRRPGGVEGREVLGACCGM